MFADTYSPGGGEQRADPPPGDLSGLVHVVGAQRAHPRLRVKPAHALRRDENVHAPVREQRHSAATAAELKTGPCILQRQQSMALAGTADGLGLKGGEGGQLSWMGNLAPMAGTRKLQEALQEALQRKALISSPLGPASTL